MDLHGDHKHVAGLLESARSPSTAEERGDDAGRVAPPVRARELVEDPAEAPPVEPEGGGFRRRGPRVGTEVPWLPSSGPPPARPSVDLGIRLALDGGGRGRRRRS
uniref:Uncharacterized protein n=1 Tax=Arundo donax TaxID=35708 RepID=A0A0A8ZE00_ARUDO